MKTNSRSGLTILEVALAFTIFSVIAGGAVLVVNAAQHSFGQSLINTTVNTKVSRAVNRVARRLTGAGRGTLFPQPVVPFGSDNLTFQTVAGWNAGAIVWSNDTELRLEYEEGEFDNGLDDDGDGFVDECQLVMTENLGQPDEIEVVILTTVSEFLEGEVPDGVDNNGNGLEDERGLSFELDVDELMIRISVMHQEPDGGVDLRTLETSIALRN